MKVAILHYSVPPVVGGVESVIYQHARLLGQAGHDVHLLAGRGYVTHAGVSMHQIPLFDSRHPQILAVKADLDRGRIPVSFDALKNEIIQNLETNLQNIDLVIAHNIGSLHKNLPLTCALEAYSSRIKSPPLVLWHHDLAWKSSRYSSELFERYPWDLLKNDWGCVQKHVVVSTLRQHELSDLFVIPPDAISVIPNGIDLNTFLGLDQQTITLIDTLHLLDGGPILFLPVRITTRKNIELALRALPFLKNTFPGVRLLVSGPLGPHNPSNQEYYNQLISLRDELGMNTSAHFFAEITNEFLPDRVISDLFRLADALLLPSKDEGFGIPIIEAGISGLPIFCTDIPSLRELAGDYADYFLPDETPENLARIISLRLKNDAVYLMREKVRRSFSWDKIYSLYLFPLMQSIGDKRMKPSKSNMEGNKRT